VYPLHPPDSRVLVRVPSDISFLDRLIVAGSSIFIVGSLVWVPLTARWVYRRWKQAKDKRKRAMYASLLVILAVLVIGGPHRSPRVGKWLQVRKWSLFQAWVKFIAMEVILDQPKGITMDVQQDKAIFAFAPHGIFPFAFAFGVLPDIATQSFGYVRPVVATATRLFPVVRDFISWANPVDASKDSVERALALGDRIAVIPGGIAEIFEGYPKPNTHPDEEYAIVRSGFLRLAIKHGIPVIPVYCFGATKMLKRLELPGLEQLSLFLRVSICLFFGVGGLPIPFRQRLSYVMGQPILPPVRTTGSDISDAHVKEMQDRFCAEVQRLFDRHKEAYGWSHKTLKLLEQ
jgi:1-acyl-sn-glycerol-3-phosphate acyltransferase